MAVVIRMKRMGRKNREYYRICATDRRSPRDGRVIEEIGTYDPHVKETDARCTLDGARIQHWLSVGAQPTDRLVRFFADKGLVAKPVRAEQTKQPQPKAKAQERIKAEAALAAAAAAAQG